MAVIRAAPLSVDVVMLGLLWAVDCKSVLHLLTITTPSTQLTCRWLTLPAYPTWLTLHHPIWPGYQVTNKKMSLPHNTSTYSNRWDWEPDVIFSRKKCNLRISPTVVILHSWLWLQSFIQLWSQLFSFIIAVCVMEPTMSQKHRTKESQFLEMDLL